MARPEDAEPPILCPPVRSAVHEWLTEIGAAEDLKKVGLDPRNSAMLVGPPGCGKTTLAHHVAARLGLPMVVVKSEALVGSHLGEFGRNVGRLFDDLAEHAGRFILFMDEIDAIAAERTTDNQACAREMNAALTVLLNRIENFSGIAVAATNRGEAIDKALWRRFGLHLDVQLPGDDERFAILKRYIAPYVLPEHDLDALALATKGAAPSLLRQLMEGIKRNLILAPKLGRPTGREIFAAVIEAARPHPSYDPPLLWADEEVRGDVIDSLSWPPQEGPPQEGKEGKA